LPIIANAKDNCLSVSRYLYCEDAELGADSVMDVLYAARKYAVQGLETLCREYLNSNKTVENVCTILEQAHLFDDEELQTDCLKLIFAEPTAVLKSAGIQDLSSASLEKILDGEELKAPEDVIFGAMLIWADGECCRRHLEVTDENRRNVLGRLLYLIRFPVMDKDFYTNTVARSNILSPEEKVELFNCHLGQDKSLSTHFSTKYREVTRCLRFKSVSSGSWNINGTSPDAISFTSSRDIDLIGILIYGCLSGSATYDISLEVYDSGTMVGRTKQSLPTNDKTRMYEVVLPGHVSVKAGKLYTVKVETRGPKVYYGECGMATVNVRQVSFQFSKSNMSIAFTTVEMGQIPGLLFR
jgi:BTB/POZ domain-containing protein 1/2